MSKLDREMWHFCNSKLTEKDRGRFVQLLKDGASMTDYIDPSDSHRRDCALLKLLRVPREINFLEWLKLIDRHSTRKVNWNKGDRWNQGISVYIVLDYQNPEILDFLLQRLTDAEVLQAEAAPYQGRNLYHFAACNRKWTPNSNLGIGLETGIQKKESPNIIKCMKLLVKREGLIPIIVPTRIRGNTPLHFAVDSGLQRCTSLLLNSMDLRCVLRKNLKGRCVLDFYDKPECRACVRIVRTHVRTAVNLPFIVWFLTRRMTPVPRQYLMGFIWTYITPQRRVTRAEMRRSAHYPKDRDVAWKYAHAANK